MRRNTIQQIELRTVTDVAMRGPEFSGRPLHSANFPFSDSVFSKSPFRQNRYSCCDRSFRAPAWNHGDDRVRSTKRA